MFFLKNVHLFKIIVIFANDKLCDVWNVLLKNVLLKFK